jgi:hypothetical protein
MSLSFPLMLITPIVAVLCYIAHPHRQLQVNLLAETQPAPPQVIHTSFFASFAPSLTTPILKQRNRIPSEPFVSVGMYYWHSSRLVLYSVSVSAGTSASG